MSYVPYVIFKSYLPNVFHCYYKSGQIYCKSGDFCYLKLEPGLLQIGAATANGDNYYKSVHNSLQYEPNKNLCNININYIRKNTGTAVSFFILNFA